MYPWGCRRSLGVHSVLEVHQLACGTCVEADKTIPSVPEPSCLLLAPGCYWSWPLATILAELSPKKQWRGHDLKFSDITSWP